MAYNPGIAYNGNQALFAGISAGAGRLADFLTKQADDSGKAKGLRQVIKAYAPDMDTHHLGLHELEGIVQGHALANADKKSAGDLQEQQNRMGVANNYVGLAQDNQRLALSDQEYRQDPTNPQNAHLIQQTEGAAEDRDAAQASQGRLATFNDEMDATTKRLADFGLQPNSRDVMRAAAKTRTLGDPNIDRILAAQTHYEDSGQAGDSPSLAATFEEDEKTGARFIRSGKSLLPSGNARTGQNADGTWAAQDVVDADGNPIGRAIRGKNGAPQLLPRDKPMTASDRLKIHDGISRLEMRLKAEKDPDHQTQIKADIDELRGTLVPAKGKPAAAAPAGPAVDPVEKEAADIDVSQIPKGKQGLVDSLLRQYRAKPGRDAKAALLKRLTNLAKGKDE